MRSLCLRERARVRGNGAPLLSQPITHFPFLTQTHQLSKSFNFLHNMAMSSIVLWLKGTTEPNPQQLEFLTKLFGETPLESNACRKNAPMYGPF
jgi:hypothetical protein